MKALKAARRLGYKAR